jgi:signal transduction histidine kinase
MMKINKQLTTNGEVKLNLEPVSTKNHIFEIAKILNSYNELAEKTTNILMLVIEANKKATMAELACQVSHDIYSPLAALEMIVKTLPEIPEQSRILIRSSIGRIRDIANNLIQNHPKPPYLETDRKSHLINSEEKSIQLIPSLVDRLISEKRMQFRTNMDIRIDFNLDERSYGIFADINIREFMRLLSNLINNAVEALGDEGGSVIVSITQSENFSIITIEDNGCGISSTILDKLGQRGGTFGKRNGSGLGLYHAKQNIESWGGQLRIESILGKGTTVKLILPLAKAATWFVESLQVTEKSKIVILDDDVSIHQVWSNRFEKSDIGNENIEIFHFSTPDKLALWAQSNKNVFDDTVFLIDYEFQNLTQVGLDIIEDLQIQSRSILITSRYEEAAILLRCERAGVKVIPKDLVCVVPIITRKKTMKKFVLIDDDSLIRSCWQHEAEAKKIVLSTFSTGDEFMRAANTFAKCTSIYVDVSLANGERGEDVAMQIYNLGFSNINLATGYEPTGFTNLPFIKSVAGKHPPF